MDGWEACKRMKALSTKLIVFIASGYLDPNLRAEISEGGIQGFIEKPYRPNEVLMRVREALNSR
jgi:DNA-binding response OmpR family regulator